MFLLLLKLDYLFIRFYISLEETLTTEVNTRISALMCDQTPTAVLLELSVSIIVLQLIEDHKCLIV